MPQLKMIMLFAKFPVPEIPEPGKGFRVRTFTEKDRPAYLELRRICGFNSENTAADLAAAQANMRDGGFVLIEESSTGKITASAMSRKGYYKDYDNLSWVMTDPAFRGRSFGRIVCIAALRCSQKSGAAGMTLATDDFREPALRMYLKLGWRPWLYTDKDRMKQRWLDLRDKLEIEGAAEFMDFSR